VLKKEDPHRVKHCFRPLFTGERTLRSKTIKQKKSRSKGADKRDREWKARIERLVFFSQLRQYRNRPGEKKEGDKKKH